MSGKVTGMNSSDLTVFSFLRCMQVAQLSKFRMKKIKTRK